MNVFHLGRAVMISLLLAIAAGAHAAPASLTLTATASDDGAVAKVEFLIGEHG